VELEKINPLVDLQVIVDEVKWRQLPDEFSPVEKEAMAANCTIESCTTHKIYIGYVYMGYWRYRGMAYEESLQDFDYFITLDGDAYLTRPWDFDPFQLLHDNNLTGFFVTDFSNYGFDDGIEETAYAVFGKSLEGRGYLNSNDTFPFFDRDGKFNHRSIYGYFFGGRLDFFRLPEFREFSRRMVKYTYDSRVDEQVVIGMGWSMLAGDRVWHLPTRGYRLGVYHQSTVDDEILVNCFTKPPPEGAPVFNDTERGFCYWSNRGIPSIAPDWYPFPQYAREASLANYNDLVRSLLAARGDDAETTRNLEASWEECYCQPTKEGSYYANQCKE